MTVDKDYQKYGATRFIIAHNLEHLYTTADYAGRRKFTFASVQYNKSIESRSKKPNCDKMDPTRKQTTKYIVPGQTIVALWSKEPFSTAHLQSAIVRINKKQLSNIKNRLQSTQKVCPYVPPLQEFRNSLIIHHGPLNKLSLTKKGQNLVIVEDWGQGKRNNTWKNIIHDKNRVQYY